MRTEKPELSSADGAGTDTCSHARRDFVTKASMLALVGMIGESAIADTKMSKGQRAYYKFFTEAVPKNERIWKELFTRKTEKEFASLSVRMGKKLKFEFSEKDVMSVMKMGRSPKSDLISDKELTTVALGKPQGSGWCDGSWDHTNGLATDTACCP